MSDTNEDEGLVRTCQSLRIVAHRDRQEFTTPNSVQCRQNGRRKYMCFECLRDFPLDEMASTGCGHLCEDCNKERNERIANHKKRIQNNLRAIK